eukprot:g4166.t1
MKFLQACAAKAAGLLQSVALESASLLSCQEDHSDTIRVMRNTRKKIEDFVIIFTKNPMLIRIYLAGKNREQLLLPWDECVEFYVDKKQTFAMEAAATAAKRAASKKQGGKAPKQEPADDEDGDSKTVGDLSTVEKQSLLRARQEVFSFLYLCLSGVAKTLARPYAEARPNIIGSSSSGAGTQ